MSQWDFLDFLAAEAERLAIFRLLMETEAKNLLAQKDRISGIPPTGRNGHIQIRAGLTVAADGRHFVLRAKSALKAKYLGAPFDVMWLRLPMKEGDLHDLMARIKDGQSFVMIPRNDYWQCGYLISKGAFTVIKANVLARFCARLKEIAGFAAPRLDEAIRGFSHVKLLNVMVNRMEQWARLGLLCIGDAVHAMSPEVGVSINLAVQDAVATANILGPMLQKRDRAAERSQESSAPPRIFHPGDPSVSGVGAESAAAPTLRAAQTPKPPLVLQWLNAWPGARQFPGRFIGLDVRPEHATLAPRRVDPFPLGGLTSASPNSRPP